ncbi:SDR family oxidoreductase [Frankia sp. AgB1.9]|uniref:SDR family NAD(P)-dependent oxidoreductase n=1 Tax=unclassified Frankia TaxID=2632575 RepID=UPI001931C7C8|nr:MULTISPECIES: SDR family NAD(P)-dependent oxidoreductase [unclassified Frankia]MBL7488489.1 SDR family oxidoreductase [Frankia sp. AgW1.1]MBL7547272.1 SDR family oxidoreductase [Frankia sp. AgB1.9]MBL7620823.1 SDR family oxidoreductase [Frankia sp. AgB1.8]
MSSFPAWAEPKTVIVTGGGRGIGAAISSRLAAEGAAVAVWDLDGDTAKATAAAIEEAGGRAIGLAVDVADRARIDAAAAEVDAVFGPATILVNNAGISPFKRFLDITRDDYDRVFAVNLRGTFDCCQAIAPGMIAARWGRIVNIASSAGQTGNALQTHYAATKAGVIGLTMSLAKELGPKGITVNAIPPSFVDTPTLQTSQAAGFLGQGVETHVKTTPVRRVGRPEDIAAACAYLVRDEASFITGQVVGVNGGRTIG